MTGQPTHTRNANPSTRKRVLTIPSGTSRTKQSFAPECDINKILRKFEKNGALNHVMTSPPQYGNFIGYQDYHKSMNKILEAQDAFAAIPSAIRSTFNNDPALFLEFAQNPDNLDQMVALGLAEKPAKEATEADLGGQGGKTPPTNQKSTQTPSAPDKSTREPQGAQSAIQSPE